MTVLFRALVVRWIARRRLRSALAVLSVALGVAAFLASTAVSGSIERTANAAMVAVSGGADLGVEAGETGVPASWAKELVNVDGVAGAAPVLLGWVSVRGATKGRVLVIGIDPAAEMGLRRFGAGPAYVPDDPVAFGVGAGAIVTRPLVVELGAGEGRPVLLPGPKGVVRLAVAGVLEPRGPERALGGRVLVVTLGLAQRLFGRGALVDRIDVRLAEGADPEVVKRRIIERILDRAPAGLYVGPPRPVDPTVGDVLGSVNVALRIGAAVSLLIGMFLIHHTVSIGVAERRRDVGVLRALGATQGQVRRVFAGEAVVLGLLGSALGVGLGLLLAQGALQGFAGSISNAYFAGEPAPAEISWRLALAGLAIGALVALAAAWFPAASAAAEAPCDAIRRGPEERTGRRVWTTARVVVALAGAAACAVLVVAPHLAGRWTGYLAALLGLIAYLAAAPAFLAAGARLIAPFFARYFGIPGRLAADQLERNPVRAALPAAALTVGLALVVETSGTMVTLSETTIEWMDQQIAGDLFVSSGTTVMGIGGSHVPMDASLTADVAGVPGVAHVVGVRFRQVAWRDTKLLVWAFDIAPYRHVARLAIEGGPRDEVLAKVQMGGACLVSDNLMRLHDVGMGDDLDIPGPRGTVPLRVVGSFSDLSWPRGALIVDRAWFGGEMDDPLVDEFSVKLAPGVDVDEATKAIVAALGPERDTVVMTALQLQVEARELLESFFSLSYAQIAAALTVAFLGVVNSMWIAVVLRRRELGLLRAVGASRGQVTRSIVLEAAGLGVIGAICGLVGGAAIEWLAIYRVLPAETGWTFPMRYPWTIAAATAVLGVATSALAGLVPARAAAGFSLREVLADE